MNQYERELRRKWVALLKTADPAPPKRRRYREQLPVAVIDLTETRKWFVPRHENK
jgi:hypothetical protein